jgi:TonB-linked SusC/RagA family outer membrane protein
MRKLLLTLLFAWYAFICLAQNNTITGTVTDDKGDPLPGAVITLKQTQLRAVVNPQGGFAISLPNGSGNILIFTFIGFKSQEVDITGKTTVAVKLLSVSTDMTEVVVTALGINRAKASLGVSQQSVNVEDMTEARASNIADLLDGKVAGLQVTTSGQSNGSTRLVLRGMGSISGDNQPLWVVDGVPIDNTDSNGQVGNLDYGNNAANLNPDDIASLEVLKGPNAAALYGSRAANGAILVTTKKGKKGNGWGVSLNSNYMASQIQQFPYFQNIYGEGGNSTLNINNVNSHGIVQEGAYNTSYGGPLLGQPYATYSGKPTTYSPQLNNVTAFYQRAYSSTQNVSISNANENSSFRFSYTRNDANDVIIQQNLQTKDNFSFNASKTFNPMLTIDTRLQYVKGIVQNRTYRNGDPNNITNVYYNLTRSTGLADFSPWKDGSGNEFANGTSTYENPMWIINEDSNQDINNTVIGGLTATLHFLPSLSFRAQSSTNMIWGNRNTFIQKGSLKNLPGSYNTFQQNNQNWNTEGLLMYNKQFKNFSIIANFGGNIRSLNYYNATSNLTSLAAHDIKNLSNNGSVPTTSELLTKSQTNSLYGTASFGYKSYLYVDVTGRNDWSSTLPAANRSFFYPSISSSFVFSEFFKIPQNIISFGKLRAAIAMVGNDTSPYNLISSFNYAGNFNSNPYVTFDTQLKNSNLKPEQTTSTEIGTELKFLKDRISLDASIYQKDTRNQILSGTVSSTTGFSTRFINAGEVQNKGFEISINATPIQTRSFTWNVTANFSTNSNKVLSLSDGLTQFKLGGTLLTSVYAEVGQPIGVLRGEDQAKDANGNVLIQPANGQPYSMSTPFTTDAAALPILGNFQPKGLGSFGSTFKYKSWDLSFLISARFGGQIFSGSYWQAEQKGVTIESLGGRDAYEFASIILGEASNSLLGKTSLYNLPYPDASRPKGMQFQGYFPLTDAQGNIVYDSKGLMIADLTKPNTLWIQPQAYWGRAYHINSMITFDDSYIKLNQVIIGYTVPIKLLQRTGNLIRTARVSLVSRNLWTILQHTPRGVDPESAMSSGNSQGLENGGALPYTSYGFDLKLSF